MTKIQIQKLSPAFLASNCGLTLMSLLVFQPCGVADSLNTRVSVVAAPATTSVNPFYNSNRQPLQPSALIKLPIGNIVPHGWLRGQLQLEADGMIGHLEEISKWCKFENSAWASPDGHG